jgi:hypothetical protein
MCVTTTNLELGEESIEVILVVGKESKVVGVACFVVGKMYWNATKCTA